MIRSEITPVIVIEGGEIVGITIQQIRTTAVALAAQPARSVEGLLAMLRQALRRERLITKGAARV